MSIFGWLYEKYMNLRGYRRVCITLIGEAREDGYIFLHSPELKGFSLLLPPGSDKDLKALTDAIFEPLDSYVHAYFRAKAKAAMNVRSVEIAESQSYPRKHFAKLCPA